VTSSDIAAALKCNDEHPLEEDLIEEEPPMLSIADIIGDMCRG
jgi:hypothetical protein